MNVTTLIVHVGFMLSIDVHGVAFPIRIIQMSTCIWISAGTHRLPLHRPGPAITKQQYQYVHPAVKDNHITPSALCYVTHHALDPYYSCT